jgi:DNA-directed RNA polymerase subunit RPC12/RpoP
MSCRGICNRFKAKKPNASSSRYIHGQKRCQVCEEWMNYDGSNCPCCGIKLRTKPRSKDGKEVYAKGIIPMKVIVHGH